MVGSAENQRNESGARENALRDAGGMAQRTVGISVPVRAESWCVTTSKKRERGPTRYGARVLAFVSNDAIALARAQEEARIAAQQEQQRLAAEQYAREQARLDAEREAAARDAANNPTPTENPTDWSDTTTNPSDPTPSNPTPSGGSRDVDRILTHTNRTVMVSFGGRRVLRLHRGYAAAPAD